MKQYIYRATLFVALLTGSSIVAAAGPKENLATASRVYTEKMGQGKFDKLDEIYHPDFVGHVSGQSFPLEASNAAAQAMRASFPDLKVEIRQVLADGDYVTIWWGFSGTNTGESPAFPRTGKAATMDALSLFRFNGGRIAEEWSAYDYPGLQRQLGIGQD